MLKLLLLRICASALILTVCAAALPEGGLRNSALRSLALIETLVLAEPIIMLLRGS